MIKPEIREFIRQLRAGKSSADAMQIYCWAKCVLPIRREDWEGTERGGLPNRRAVAWGYSMAPAMAADKFDEGGTDDEIADAFQAGLAIDHERGILWREMEKDERPMPATLLRSMSADQVVEAGDMLGHDNIRRILLSRVSRTRLTSPA